MPVQYEYKSNHRETMWGSYYSCTDHVAPEIEKGWELFHIVGIEASLDNRKIEIFYFRRPKTGQPDDALPAFKGEQTAQAEPIAIATASEPRIAAGDGSSASKGGT